MAPCDGSSSVMAVDRATTFNVDAFFTSEAFTGAVGLPPRKRYTVPAAFADHPAAGRARLAVSPDAAWSVRVPAAAGRPPRPAGPTRGPRWRSALERFSSDLVAYAVSARFSRGKMPG